MSVLPIKIYGSPILREKAEAIEEITDEVRRLVKVMRDSLYYYQGVGLAANQIGEAKRLFLIDEGKGLKVFINPRILRSEDITTAEEGCLSIQ